MASTGEVWRLGRRPALDGLRGIAVLAVMAQHMGAPPPIAGIGVPLFFALSGYLITGLLLDEHIRTGSIAIGAFYLRRAVRLVPALLVAVAVVDPIYVLGGAPQGVISSICALLYMSNYVTIATGHFPAGWGQTWSLAIEEHFYLVWPVLFLFLARRMPLRRLLVAVLTMCALDMAWRGVLIAHGASNVLLSVGSLEQADSLLYGCAAAVAVRMGWLPRRWMLPVAVGLMLGWFVLWEDPWSHWFLMSAWMGSTGAVIAASVDQRVSRLATAGCGWGPLVEVGLRSYGLYLWHQPLQTVATLAGLTGGVALTVSATATFAAAWLSYHFVEVPVRRRFRVRRLSVTEVERSAVVTRSA